MRKATVFLAIIVAAGFGYQLGAGSAATVRAADDESLELMELDREVDRATAKNGVDGWVAYFAGDAVMLPNGGEMVIGKEAIREMMGPKLNDPSYSRRREPVDALVSDNLGYTHGVSKTTMVKADGTTEVSYGKYVTVWQRQRGSIMPLRRQAARPWTIVLDIENSSPAPKAATGASAE